MLESRAPGGTESRWCGILIDAPIRRPYLDVWLGKSVTRLSGKAALITGGGTGIGRAIALAFARDGASVAVAGRRLDKLKAVAREIDQQGGAALALECDVTRAKDAERVVRETAKKFGTLNVLVNNAGT